jgi:thymidylate synthase
MSIVGDRYVMAGTLSEAWLDAVRLVFAVPSKKVVHLVIRITAPNLEDVAVRYAAQQLIDSWNAAHPNSGTGMEHIETTRNTIFPASFASRTNGPEDLASYYRQRLTKDGLLGFTHNARGTYFGRIVAYPRGDGEQTADQLSDTVRKLREELSHRSSKSSRYEISIYNERLDRSPMSFPCLAHLSLHLHDRRLHLQAVYRNEYLVGRAYGNFLGLAQLQSYIAGAVGLDVGELMVTAGHAELDGTKGSTAAMLERIEHKS